MEVGLMDIHVVRSVNRSWIYDTQFSLYRAFHPGGGKSGYRKEHVSVRTFSLLSSQSPGGAKCSLAQFHNGLRPSKQNQRLVIVTSRYDISDIYRLLQQQPKGEVAIRSLFTCAQSKRNKWTELGKVGPRLKFTRILLPDLFLSPVSSFFDLKDHVQVLYQRVLTKYLNDYSLLSSTQYGFQRGLSTYMALLDLQSNISEAMNNNMFPLESFLIFRKPSIP